MGHQIRTHQKYLVIGTVILAINIVIIYVLLNYFLEKVANADNNYSNSRCLIANISVDIVPFNCKNQDSGLTNLVTIPCMRVFVNLVDHGNVGQYLRLYRNMEEKLLAVKNELEVSIIIHCLLKSSNASNSFIKFFCYH